MNMNDILTLAKAGFTANQIAALNTINNQPTQQVQQLQQVQQTGNPLVPVNPDPLAAMANQIQQLTNTVQASNILGSQMAKPETTDDILANIINPPSVVNPGGTK